MSILFTFAPVGLAVRLVDGGEHAGEGLVAVWLFCVRGGVRWVGGWMRILVEIKEFKLCVFK